jgi:hypothetical protein
MTTDTPITDALAEEGWITSSIVGDELRKLERDRAALIAEFQVLANVEGTVEPDKLRAFAERALAAVNNL